MVQIPQDPKILSYKAAEAEWNYRWGKLCDNLAIMGDQFTQERQAEMRDLAETLYHRANGYDHPRTEGLLDVMHALANGKWKDIVSDQVAFDRITDNFQLYTIDKLRAVNEQFVRVGRVLSSATSLLSRVEAGQAPVEEAQEYIAEMKRRGINAEKFETQLKAIDYAA